MKDAELALLAPVFRPGERRLDKTPIDWPSASYNVFYWLKLLRLAVGSPLFVLRESHGYALPDLRHYAVDFCFPKVPLSLVARDVERLPGASYGLYCGLRGPSLHVDFRSYGPGLPARWMAFPSTDEPLLQARELDAIITKRDDGWLYLRWSDPRALEAEALLYKKAEERRRG